MNKRDFGSRLRAARRARGVSQEKLGALLGLSHAAVSRWEANESRPAFENLEALHQHLEVSVDVLMFGESHQVRDEVAHYSALPIAADRRPLSIDEAELLDRYRSSSAEKKKAIMVLLK